MWLPMDAISSLTALIFGAAPPTRVPDRLQHLHHLAGCGAQVWVPLPAGINDICQGSWQACRQRRAVAVCHLHTARAGQGRAGPPALFASACPSSRVHSAAGTCNGSCSPSRAPPRGKGTRPGDATRTDVAWRLTCAAKSSSCSSPPVSRMEKDGMVRANRLCLRGQSRHRKVGTCSDGQKLPPTPPACPPARLPHPQPNGQQQYPCTGTQVYVSNSHAHP